MNKAERTFKKAGGDWATYGIYYYMMYWDNLETVKTSNESNLEDNTSNRCPIQGTKINSNEGNPLKYVRLILHYI